MKINILIVNQFVVSYSQIPMLTSDWSIDAYGDPQNLTSGKEPVQYVHKLQSKVVSKIENR